jgi:BirA family biotin operon repressor/biotin-[acetyl-CoA-carboxylase] ligase
VSGEEMAEELAISRAAICKQVKALRKRGYDISSSTKKGYRLTGKPDLMDVDRIQNSLKTSWLGKDLRIFDEVQSTNATALSSVRDSPNGTVVLAETQIQGKGRLARLWASPPGGIWMSLVLKPKIPLSEVSRINMAVGVAICRTISSSFGLQAGIKWPNDILIGDRKLCGMLTEIGAQMDQLDYAVVGVGLNANNDPASFPSDWRATSLASELGREIDRCDLVAGMLGDMEAAIDDMNSPKIYEEWRRLSVTLNEFVRISSRSGDIDGEVVDLADDGALLLRQGNGLLRVLAGDCIHLRPQKSGAH